MRSNWDAMRGLGLGVRAMQGSACHSGLWGCESRSRRHRRKRLLDRTAEGLGFVRFRQLSGAGARDFGVRLLTTRQGGPAALFHKFLLAPCTRFLELYQFDRCIGLRQELLDANGRESGDKRRIHAFLCEGLRGAAQCPAQPTKADNHDPDSADDATPKPRFHPWWYLHIRLLGLRRKPFSPWCPRAYHELINNSCYIINNSYGNKLQARAEQRLLVGLTFSASRRPLQPPALPGKLHADGPVLTVLAGIV